MYAETLDPVLTFLAIKEAYPEAFFFQSKSQTVIGLNHQEKIRLVGNQVHISSQGSTTISSESFLECLNVRQQRFQQKASFPFEHGGIFGCLGHEVVGDIEPRLKKAGYFSSLGNSQEVLAEVLVSRNLIVFDHQNNSVHFALHDLERPMHLLRARLNSEVESTISGTADFSSCTSRLGKFNFLQKVNKIKEHIKAGDIFQAVLSERFERTIESSPVEIFQVMKRTSQSAYSFFFDFEQSSFLGASPELLVKVVDDQMETHPIAGTRPRSCNSDIDQLLERELCSSVKEGAEHLMLVDLARNDLGRVAEPGSVRVDAFRELLRLPSVMHLISVVTGTKKQNVSALGALKACFPAGTLSGAPKIRAMEILAEQETGPRGFYGGAVVAMDFSGDLDSCIAIRSLEIKDKTAILRAGAGIVADSDPESEYLEIIHKLSSLIKVLDLVHEEKKEEQKVIA